MILRQYQIQPSNRRDSSFALLDSSLKNLLHRGKAIPSDCLYALRIELWLFIFDTFEFEADVALFSQEKARQVHLRV